MMLTPGQFRVARMYAAGLSYAEIARRLHLHANTPSTIVSRVRLRLGVHERRDIAAMLERCEVRSRQGRASRHGWSHGDTVRIVGGPWAGRVAKYERGCNGREVWVRLNAAVMVMRTQWLERA